MMKVDVIVLTKNSEKTLNFTLESIAREVPCNELIVVDGGSNDKTLEIANKYDARIIKEVKGIALARYVGALASSTEWICYVDSDIYLYPLWYKWVSRWAKDSEIVWIQGLTLEHSYTMMTYALSKTLRYLKWGCVSLSNSLIKRDVVISCKSLMDKNLNAGEDAVLYRHVKSLGGCVILEPKAQSLHIPDSFPHDMHAYYRAGSSQKTRHKVPRPWYIAMPLLLLREGLVRYLIVKDANIIPLFMGMFGTAYLMGYIGLNDKLLERFLKNLEEIRAVDPIKIKDIYQEIISNFHLKALEV